MKSFFKDMKDVDYARLVIEYAEGWEEGLCPEEWKATTINDIREAVKLDGIYEQLTARDFAIFCDSILTRVYEDAWREENGNEI